MKKNTNQAAVISYAGGIYFVAPFPQGWEVRAFPFAIYPDAGHPLFWDQSVAAEMALRWAKHFYTTEQLDRQSLLIVALKRRIAGLYDGVPRGRAQKSYGHPEHCVVHHGDDLTPAMGVNRREISKHLLLPSDARWAFDDHETRNADSTERLRLLLRAKPTGSSQV